MIQVIDRIKYFPERNNDLEKLIYNQAYKALVEEVKKKINPLQGTATITVMGNVKKGDNYDMNFLIEDCSSDSLLEDIKTALGIE